MQVQTSSIEQTRNIGILAHIDAGKTTTTERILFYSGVSRRMGEVDDGTAVTDWMVEEQNRGISITAAATSFPWRDYHVNLIDTPGHVDFTVEVERSLRVLDGVVAVLCAVSGVESQTETVWRQADRYRVPRLVFINKCDRVGADPEAVTEQMRQRFDAHPVVLHFPHTLGEGFNGLVDLVNWRSRVWDDETHGVVFEDSDVPAELEEEAGFARDVMIEALAEVDDELMEEFLSGKEITPEEISMALRRATLALKAVPVLLGASRRNKGVQGLLDAVIDFLPAPSDLPPVNGHHPTTLAKESRKPLPEEPATALAFKIANDARAGTITYVRMYSGELSTGDVLYNPRTESTERIGRIVKMHADDCIGIPKITTGDIAAVSGLKSVRTGDTLCDPKAKILLDTIRFPEPVIRVAVEPDTTDDAIRLAEGLTRLISEDPTFRMDTDPETSQIIISGMGELHLEVLANRLFREYDVKAKVGRPQVAYRESIRAKSEVEKRIDKLSPSGAGQFAQIKIELSTTERGAGLSFENKISSDHLPREFSAAAEAGIRQAMHQGPLGGFTMTDLRVVMVDGIHHPVDSSHAAFKVAGLQAFVEAVRLAGPTLLEPIMDVEVAAPDVSVGEVVGDLNARRGKITGIEARSGVQVVSCLVPLAAMFGYATELRSRTQGRATFSMQFKQYAEVPSSIAEKIVAKSNW